MIRERVGENTKRRDGVVEDSGRERKKERKTYKVGKGDKRRNSERLGDERRKKDRKERKK